MSETAKFYTAEQKDVLKAESETDRANKNPMFQSTGLMILDTLGEQQNTLQNIERILQSIEHLLSAGEQHEVIRAAVEHAFLNGKYHKIAVKAAIQNIDQ